MKYTNSSLATVFIESPNHYNGRYEGYYQTDCGIDRFTPHCMAFDGTIERCGNGFASPLRNAASNYGIGSDGRIGMYVEEKNGSWCTSNKENDLHAITVEIADNPNPPYVMTDKAIESCIKLAVDIMKRYGFNKMVYLGSLEATKSYKRADDEIIMTLHRWFAPKACPGDYFVSKIPYIISEINKRVAMEPKECFGKITVVGNRVNVRKEPENNSSIYKIKSKGDVINIIAVCGDWYKTINGNYVYNDSRVEFKSSIDKTIKESKMYEKLSLTSKVLKKVPSNTKVLYIGDTYSGWSKIWYDGKTGYVKNVNLEGSNKLSKYAPYNLSNDVWLRKKPNLLSVYKIKKIKKNEKLYFVADYNSRYCQVIYKNKTYYIRKNKLH